MRPYLRHNRNTSKCSITLYVLQRNSSLICLPISFFRARTVRTQITVGPQLILAELNQTCLGLKCHIITLKFKWPLCSVTDFSKNYSFKKANIYDVRFFKNIHGQNLCSKTTISSFFSK